MVVFGPVPDAAECAAKRRSDSSQFILDPWWNHRKHRPHQKPVRLHPPQRLRQHLLTDAAHQLADGYPDPKTGECTALSSAYNFKAVAAFVIHPETESRTAGNSGPLDRFVSYVKGLIRSAGLIRTASAESPHGG